MIQFQQSGIINAPIERVFNTIASPERIPLWRKDVPAITNISSKTPFAGLTFQEEVHFMGKKNLLMMMTSYIPFKKIVIEARGGMKLLPKQTFEFTDLGNQTRINLTVEMKVSGLFKIMEPVLPAQLKKIWAGYFRNLDEL